MPVMRKLCSFMWSSFEETESFKRRHSDRVPESDPEAVPVRGTRSRQESGASGRASGLVFSLSFAFEARGLPGREASRAAWSGASNFLFSHAAGAGRRLCHTDSLLIDGGIPHILLHVFHHFFHVRRKILRIVEAASRTQLLAGQIQRDFSGLLIHFETFPVIRPHLVGV